MKPISGKLRSNQNQLAFLIVDTSEVCLHQVLENQITIWQKNTDKTSLKIKIFSHVNVFAFSMVLNGKQKQFIMENLIIPT